MAKLWRWAAPLFYGCIALQALLCWSCGSAELPEGSLSIDCGAGSTTTVDAETRIEWISDAGLMSEGESILIGGNTAPYDTMRLFKGNQSKYCYSLSSSAVRQGAFFLVRVSIWKGNNILPYEPKSPDRHFRFKLLIDADEWQDVDIADNATLMYFYQMYTRALRSSIDVCVARSTADSDPPFISSLELRPLPSSLSAAGLINRTSRRLVQALHYDFGVASTSPDWTWYPSDSLDRWWQSDTSTPALNTTSSIDTLTSADPDMVPAIILQTSLELKKFPFTFSNKFLRDLYYCVFHFAEINPAVINGSGQRAFNILLNGETTALNEKPIDVFAEVGANAAYEFVAGPLSATSGGDIIFTFSATSTSIFPPFVAAAEFFQASNNTFSAGSSPTDVSATEDLKTSMNLNSYTGDCSGISGTGTTVVHAKTGESAKTGRIHRLKQADMFYLRKWCEWSRMDMWVRSM